MLVVVDGPMEDPTPFSPPYISSPFPPYFNYNSIFIVSIFISHGFIVFNVASYQSQDGWQVNLTNKNKQTSKQGHLVT